MRALSSCIILLLFHLDAVAEESSGTQSLITNDTASSTLWEWRLEDFTESEYRKGIKPLLLAFEEAGGRKVEPGKHRRVGLKVFTNSGPGLATSKELVRALVAELEFRGFTRKEIFIIDQSERELRRAGYLPPLSLRQNDFYGVPVLALDSGAFYHPDWFYESPLPSFPVGRRLMTIGEVCFLTHSLKILIFGLIFQLRLILPESVSVVVWPTPVYGTFITIFVLLQSKTPLLSQSPRFVRFPNCALLGRSLSCHLRNSSL